MEVGQTIVLQGRALDASGAPVDVPITWRTPDTTIIVRADGQVTGRTGGSTGRVQAQAGALASDFFSFTVRPRPDTLVLSPDSCSRLSRSRRFRAVGGDAAKLRPDQPLADATIVYTVTSPAFADPAERTVELPGGGLTLAATTGADGTPATPVTLGRVAGRTAPAVAVVTSAPSPRPGAGRGSGQRFQDQFQ